MFPNQQPQPPPHAGAARVFDINFTTSRTNWTVNLPDKTPIYYVRSSSFRPGRPDITIHANGIRDGATVAVSNFVKLSSRSKLGLGDPDDAQGMVWEDLEKVSKDHSAYRFECAVGPHGQRQAFLWKRTHSVGAGTAKPSQMSNGHFKLIEEASGDVIGAFTKTNFTHFKKHATLQIDRNYGRDFDTMVFLVAFTVLERAIRRKAARGAAGGGGDN